MHQPPSHAHARGWPSFLGWLLLSGLAGCAVNPSGQPTLRAATLEERGILDQVRKEGISVVVDGCAFRSIKDPRQLRPVGLEESIALSQAEAARVRRLLQGNAINVRIDRRPFVCASHAHLRAVPVGANVDQDGPLQALPLVADPRLNSDAALAADYLQLQRLMLAGLTTRPLAPDCQWCWGQEATAIAAGPDDALLGEASARRLRADLGGRYVAFVIVGGFYKATGGEAGRFAQDVLVGIAAGRPLSFGQDDRFEQALRLIDLDTRSAPLAGIPRAVGLMRFARGSDADVQDRFFPFMGTPPMSAGETSP